MNEIDHAIEDARQGIIALVDMDGTVCDHDAALQRDMDKLRSPGEPETLVRYDDDAPDYLKARKRLVRSQPGWWLNLEPLKSGFDVLGVLKELEFDVHVLTKGPWSTPAAWSEKVQWCKKNIDPDVQITVTMDKGLVYGAVLVDDYPEYALRWLQYRPRGWVIMPENVRNTSFTHCRVLKYNGTNLEQVRELLEEIKSRVVAAKATKEIEKIWKKRRKGGQTSPRE